jgi:hypothetical protein
VTAQQLSGFLDGALSGVSRELVTRHLAACADCRERHALWHIYDEVLQRVLSWEPDEHSMEEASARVELALTAERRGLTPPGFASVLHPVIASNPTSPSTAGLYPTLPPMAPPRAAAPQWPIASAPPPPAPPAPSANAYPLDPPAMTPPPPSPAYMMAPLPPYVAPVAPPTPAAPWYTPPPPVGYAPAPPFYAPGYAPPPPPGYAPPPSSYAPPPSSYAPPLPVGYAPPPPASYSPPISVHEDMRAQRTPPAPWARTPVPPKKRQWGPVLLVGAALLAVVLFASPWVPDVIRIRLPDGQQPSVELVHQDAPAAAATAQDPQLRLAERTSSEPPATPYRALPADSADRSAAAAAAHVESTAQALPVVIAPPPPAPAAKPRSVVRTPAPVRARVPRDETASEDESGTAAGVEHSMTFVPVQVKTEVRLSSSQPSATPAPATDTVGDQALPLLCGEVVDESGAPIEGARIQVMVPSLTVRTDKRGRFCVALPAGEHTFLVDAAGFSAVTRGVELTGGTFETHVTLGAAR